MREHLDRFLSHPAVRSLEDAAFLTSERLRRYPMVFIAVYLVAAFAYLNASDRGLDPFGKPVGTDFMKVYSAGQLVAEGYPEGAYDPDKHHVAQRRIISNTGYYAWHYPPMYLFVARFLAAFDYMVALAIFIIPTFLFYLWALFRLVKRRETLLIAAAFPGVLVCAGHGQNGFLIAGLFAMLFVELEKRPVLAGSLLGIATLKPHLGLFFPLGLGVAKKGEVLMGAVMTAILIGTFSSVVFGLDTWRAFFDHTFGYTLDIILEDGAVGWFKVQSAFAAFGRIGAPSLFSYVVQGLATLFAGAVVIDLWRREEAPLELKGAAVVIGSMLGAPYFLDYDLVLLAVPIALIVRLNLEDGWEPWDKTILLGLWLLPLVARLLGFLFIPITPIVLTGALVWLRKRAQLYENVDPDIPPPKH